MWLASDNYNKCDEGNCRSADDCDDPSYLWCEDKPVIFGDHHCDDDDDDNDDDDDHNVDVLA